MQIDSLTIGEVKQLQALFGCAQKAPGVPLTVGRNYFLRTVTMYYTGKLIELHPECLVLDNAAWIADCGRFYDFLKTGKASEVEPFTKPVYIPLSALVDATEWEHALLSAQK